MSLILTLLLQTAPAPAAPPKDIVVTGQRLETTAAALAACVARHCPTEEDARATLAHAENQFVAGDYAAARRTLRGSINRNQRFAENYPVPVSDLLRADARMNLHLGESQLYRIGQVEALKALKAGLPATDGRVLAQRVEVADAFARVGKVHQALTAYATVADEAGQAGSRTVEAYARLRRVVLLTAISNANAGYESDLRDAVRWFSDKPDLVAFRTVAGLMAAQHDAFKGDPAALDAIIARSTKATIRPQLLYAPMLTQQASERAANGGSATNLLSLNNYDGQWADVGFFVTRDGKVSDIDILREGPSLDRSWVKPITEAIARRRYAPLDLPPGDPGLLRVERYSLTAFWIKDATGTRIPVREARPRVQMIDLTADPELALKPSADSGTAEH